MSPGKSGGIIPRRDDELPSGSEVTDAMLPGKTSKLQIASDRTPNRHRWVRRES